ncbi:anoctamin-8 isoform X3 [Eurosta solidaginis]|uniref:anoctamin-8 isoform X3 n=1 Tax=Eurosta solidaginis TaxID=178769 RepID=UPI0035309945
MDKSFENLLQSGVGGDMSSERQSSDDVHESAAEDAGLDAGDDFTDENNFESNLRRRRGKIISCAKETIENASRQLRRKVPYAGHLMTPRRLWLNKIPTQCDVVIEFPEDAPDEALRWLLARLRSQPPSGLGLVVQVKAHESTRRNAFYISSPTNVLFKAAEEARLPKRLRPDLGGALREFTTRESHCFQQLKVEDGSNGLFTSQERQWLVLQVLQGLRASPTDIEALQGRAAVAEGQSIVAAWQETGLIVQVFPLHETRSLAMLQNSWVKQIFAPQPLDDIAEYFGVKVALYFAWLGHYTCALGVPAVFGTILYAALWGKGQTAQDMGHVLFSLFNVAWASLYLEAWKRYSVELAFRWGTLSTPPELLEPPRPLYKGTLVENNVTGRLEPKEAPAWKRRAFRYFVSFPIIGVCLAMVFVVMFLMLRFQDWWDSKLPEESILCCLSVIPKVLLAGVITLMDEAYYNLAVWLNDQENYRLQSKYENHLIAKVALFQFVNSFLSLFYIAFYLRDEDKLKEQLAGLLISRQIIGNLRESAIPYFIEQWKLAKLSFNMWGALSPTQNFNRTIMDVPTTTVTESDIKEKHNTNTPQHTRTRKESNNLAQESNLIKAKTSPSKRNIGQAEIESSLYKYDGTFSDHLEMLVQMGYVVLFSAAFPLAGICALINNLIEIRSDAFKLTHVHQRPFGQRVANIGTWQNAFSILSLAAVIVNCALIGLSGQVSRLWPGLTAAQTIILIVTLEHIMLGLRSALTWLLPELPSWLAAEIARAEHFRREMQCKGTSPRPTPPTPPSTTSTQPDQEALHLDIATTNDQSMESQVAEDILNQEQLRQATNYPQIDDIANYGLQRNIEADVNIFENRDSSPDSPQSQTSTILIRPLLESTPPNSGSSVTSLIYDTGHIHGRASLSSASTLALNTIRQPMHIPAIPPFRKKSSDSAEHTGCSANSSPQRSRPPIISTPPPILQHQPTKIPEIPPYKQRKISAESATQLHMSELQSNKEATDILKSAPSWGNIAIKTSIQHQTVGSSSSSSAGGGSAGSAAVTGTGRAIDSGRPSVGGFTTSTSSMHLKKISDNGKHIPSVDSSVSNVSIAHSGITEDEAKAAELAAKKSRLKQKLVKSARSVGIFSLKLKERRQREAEKAANIAIEHAKALAKLPPMPQPGGELSLIPIEQLIQIDDIKPTTKPQPNISSTTTTSATTSSATTTSPQIMTSSSSALAAAMQQFQSSGNH